MDWPGDTVAAGIIYVLIWYGPDVIAGHDVGNVTGALRTLRLQQARDAARGRLLTLAAGLFAAAALIYTAPNFNLSREGQFTDRYTKAIGQLGGAELDVRLGGIYALERIAHDSPRDHPTVIEVLAAFIREHSCEQWPPPPNEPSTARTPPRATRPDVQAAVTVIGRRNPRHDRQSINLDAANLTRADLSEAKLTWARLNGANLTLANLTLANLTAAKLFRAIIEGAILADAILADANLSRANLTGARLDGADLTYAWLIGADLTHANLTRAHLTDANLRHAILTKAILTEANLAG